MEGNSADRHQETERADMSKSTHNQELLALRAEAQLEYISSRMNVPAGFTAAQAAHICNTMDVENFSSFALQAVVHGLVNAAKK